jgi:RNA polymerase primary sigma factor
VRHQAAGCIVRRARVDFSPQWPNRLEGLEISDLLPVTVPAGLDGGFVTTATNPQLLKAALRGDAEAAEALVRSIADLVWTACLRVTQGSEDTEEVFREVMSALRADDFGRFKSYDGRTHLRIYVALVVRDLLSERVIKLLALGAGRGWRAFEGFFADDIRRMILRMLPGSTQQQNREDAYQSVCEALLKNDLQRLRAYSGRGSPSGFILHVIENLIIDYVRTIVPRRRLPAAIQRLSDLDQTVFRLLYWERLDPNPSMLLNFLSRIGEVSPTSAAIADAVNRVRQALPSGYFHDAHGQGQTVDISAADDVALAVGAEEFAVPTPEDKLVEGQQTDILEQAIALLQQAMPKLEVPERLYLQLALAGQPAREIAHVLGQPVEYVHKLAQKVKRRLRDELGDEDAVKKWRLSV